MTIGQSKLNNILADLHIPDLVPKKPANFRTLHINFSIALLNLPVSVSVAAQPISFCKLPG